MLLAQVVLFVKMSVSQRNEADFNEKARIMYPTYRNTLKLLRLWRSYFQARRKYWHATETIN